MEIYFAGVGYHPIIEKTVVDNDFNCLYSFADKRGIEQLEMYLGYKKEGTYKGLLMLDSRSI